MPKEAMQFSKQLQIGKLILVGLLFVFCGASWFVYHEMPPAEFIVTALAVAGFGDVPYQVNSAIEKKAKIEADADKFEAQAGAEAEIHKADAASAQSAQTASGLEQGEYL